MAGETEAAGLQGTAYPLVCPLNGQGKALLLCCAVPGLTGIFLPWAFWGVGGLGLKLLMLSGAAVAVGMAVWLLRTALFANLILDRDSITCHNLWSWRLDMGEITGVRGLRRKGGNVILIKNDVKRTRRFIPAGLCGNGALAEWLRSRPDLDTAAQERWRAVLFADSDLPPVIAERLAHARRGWGRSAATAVALTLVVFLLVPIPLPRLSCWRSCQF